MALIVISGPEKAGKSTLCKELRETHNAVIRPWSRNKYGAEFQESLKADVMSDGLVVWDRSWACECVYSKLLNRDTNVGSPWLAEWTMGRAASAAGVKAIWTGPSWLAITPKRDETDLPVDPLDEQKLYVHHGKLFGWTIKDHRYKILHQQLPTKHEAESLIFEAKAQRAPVQAPAYAGPWPPHVLFVEEEPIGLGTMSWLPWSDRWSTLFARRALGNDAMRVGWTSAYYFPPRLLGELMERGTRVIAAGINAFNWVKQWAPRDGDYNIMPPPVSMYGDEDENDAKEVYWEKAVGDLADTVLSAPWNYAG